MSDRSLNWLKFGGLVSLAFVLGLLFAGLLDLPRTSSAQSDRSVPAHQAQLTQSRNIANLPAVQPLAALSDAFATVAEAVRPSVVYITSRRTERTATRVPPAPQPSRRLLMDLRAQGSWKASSTSWQPPRETDPGRHPHPALHFASPPQRSRRTRFLHHL